MISLCFVLEQSDFHDLLNRCRDQNIDKSRWEKDLNTHTHTHTHTHSSITTEMLMRQISLCAVGVSDSRPAADRGSFVSRIQENKAASDLRPFTRFVFLFCVYFVFGHTLYSHLQSELHTASVDRLLPPLFSQESILSAASGRF